MIRDLNKQKQALSPEECKKILMQETSGVLALRGDDDYPYAVPVSYVYANGKLYFRSAKEGHKIDSIRKYEKTSFCVMWQDHTAPGKYATSYKSVIAFGKIHIIEEEAHKTAVMKELARGFAPSLSDDELNALVLKLQDNYEILELNIDKLTGKGSAEPEK